MRLLFARILAVLTAIMIIAVALVFAYIQNN
jgi:hypothetical protein